MYYIMYTVASNSQTGNFRVFSINPNYWCTKIRCNETLLSRCQMLHNITVRYLNSLLCIYFMYRLFRFKNYFSTVSVCANK